MESITTTSPHLSQTVIPSTPAANAAKFNTQGEPSSSTQSKRLQPVQVVISAEATENQQSTKSKRKQP